MLEVDGAAFVLLLGAQHSELSKQLRQLVGSIEVGADSVP